MNRRTFLLSVGSAALAAASGCASRTELIVDSDETDIEIDGGTATWTWMGDIDGLYGEDVLVQITLYDSQGNTVGTAREVIHGINRENNQNAKYSVTYVGSPEEIKRIVDYEVQLTYVNQKTDTDSES